MSVSVDSRAVLGKNVELGEGVVISPFAVIEDNVTIGAGTIIDAHAYIGSNTTLGSKCHVYNGSSIGTIAQDLKFHGEDCYLTIGDRTTFREFCTINKGTEANQGYTRIGNDCTFLAYCHVGHDCEIGNHLIASNNLGLAGHVIVGDHVTCGGYAKVHQFTQIGDHAFLGANTYVTMDVVPFALVGSDGDGAFIAMMNKVGLERRGYSSDDLSLIQKAYKVLFRQGLALSEATALLATEFPDSAIIAQMLRFIDGSKRGLTRMKK